MNASTSVSSTPDFITRDHDAEDSDTDTISDEIPDYYQPISSSADAGGGDVSDDDDRPLENGHHFYNLNPNNSHSNGHLVNGVMRMGSLNLSDEEETREKNESSDEEEEEEEMRRRAESDSAVRRAFEQDESRRNAPLSADNAARVREAMRGVSFTGFAPRWAGDVPEDRLLDQLRQLRQPPPHSAA